MTAGRAYDMNVELASTLITPEDSAARDLRLGGEHAVAERLARARVETICSSYAEVPRPARSSSTPASGS